MVNEQSIERAAYLAANLIEGREIKAMELSAGSPGTRRSIKLDEMARIIKEVMVKEMEVQMQVGAGIEHEVVNFSTLKVGDKFLYCGVEYTKLPRYGQLDKLFENDKLFESKALDFKVKVIRR